jgi:hypothetical protein
LIIGLAACGDAAAGAGQNLSPPLAAPPPPTFRLPGVRLQSTRKQQVLSKTVIFS